MEQLFRKIGRRPLGTETMRLRAVLDINIFVAAYKTQNATSPTAELLRRWRNGEFELFYSEDIRRQIAGKFLEKHVDSLLTEELLVDLVVFGTEVRLRSVDIKRVIPADPDDDVIVACAVGGGATHIVTYDAHFDALGESYQEIKIVDGLHFLYEVRG
ncbi:MAG: PIN domain-containing protein [Candidatus Latescibacteria bacterium]|nr:PIN domain-containing protein [Candidatus Latescibacterota bacterium]